MDVSGCCHESDTGGYLEDGKSIGGKGRTLQMKLWEMYLRLGFSGHHIFV